MAVMDLLDVDAQLVAAIGLGRPGQASMQADHGGRVGPAGQLATLDHLCNHADPAELAVLAREQENAVLITGIDRQGRGDRGEDNRFVKWNQK
jgi:hypothetical protein